MRTLSLLIAGVALSACVASEPTQSITIDPTATVGSQLVSAAAASQLFQSVCIDNAPRFVGSDAALRRLPVRQARTGTYFHQTLNLSFKIIEVGGKPACSMAFEAAEAPPVTGLAVLFAAASAAGQPDIGVAPSGIMQAPGPSQTTATFFPANQSGGLSRALLTNN